MQLVCKNEKCSFFKRRKNGTLRSLHLSYLRIQNDLIFLSQIFQANNPVYQFLSGVRITPKTVFLDPTEETEMQIIREIHHYMHFAVAVYGWPMYLRKNTATGICKLCSSLRYVNIVHNIALQYI